jgi:hypothetical protein
MAMSDGTIGVVIGAVCGLVWGALIVGAIWWIT